MSNIELYKTKILEHKELLLKYIEEYVNGNKNIEGELMQTMNDLSTLCLKATGIKDIDIQEIRELIIRAKSLLQH